MSIKFKLRFGFVSQTINLSSWLFVFYFYIFGYYVRLVRFVTTIFLRVRFHVHQISAEQRHTTSGGAWRQLVHSVHY